MKLKLIERKQEAPGVESFIFEPEEPISWTPGQYLHYVLHHEPTDDRGSDRWFTVSAAPFEKRPAITTRYADEKSSSFKKKLFSLVPGKSIEISRVEGDFIIEDPSQEYVLIAGGIGITPFHSILKQADHDGIKLNATLLYGNRDEHAVFRDELNSFAANNPNLAIHYITAPDRVDESSIRKLVPDLSRPLFYVSGPEPMVTALAQTLKGMGVSDDRIKLDDFPGYTADI
jgi:ferredoxin-NADP reductase